MVRRISVREARANFADLIGSVQHTGEPVVIERRGMPVAAVVPAAAVEPEGAGPDPAIDAEIDGMLADTPTLRAVIQVGRQLRPKVREPMPWTEARAAAREDYVAGKVRKKGLTPRGTSG
jgi:prevent-host-death family protein